MSRYQKTMRAALQDVTDGQTEFDEAVKWEVKVTGLPTFYADGKSKGEVKQMLRKLLKKPDNILSIVRTTPAELKKIRRGQISGTEPGEEDDVTEELLLEDNRIVKVKNNELTVDDIVNMIQFGKPFTVGEDIPATLPPGDPNFPKYKDIPNSVVDKEDKKANKAKARAEKDILIPTQTQEGIVSGAGKVAGAAVGGALALGVSPALGALTGAGIIKKTSDIQQKIDKRKVEKKAEQERKLAAAKAEREKKDPRLAHEAADTWLKDSEWAKAQAKDKKNQNKDPVGKTHEALDTWHPDPKKDKVTKHQARLLPTSPKKSITKSRKSNVDFKDLRPQFKEVAPPGWGHTKAEKEKTKPDKPKSKIGGSAHEFQKDLDSGKFKGLPGDTTYKDKKASMFKLMWSMKNKGDKPHYKPGVKDKLKSQYKKEDVDEAKFKHPDAGVPLSVRRARKKKSATQMKKDMKHADLLSKTQSDFTGKPYIGTVEQDLPGLGPKKKAVKNSKRVGQIYTGAQVSGEENLLDATKRYLEEKADWNIAFKSAAQSRPAMKYKDAVSFIDTAGLNSTEKRSALKAAKKWLR